MPVELETESTINDTAEYRLVRIPGSNNNNMFEWQHQLHDQLYAIDPTTSPAMITSCIINSNDVDDSTGIIGFISAVSIGLSTFRLQLSTVSSTITDDNQQYEVQASALIRKFIDSEVCNRFGDQVRRIEAICRKNDFNHQWILERIGFNREGVLRDYICSNSSLADYEDAIIYSYIIISLKR